MDDWNSVANKKIEEAMEKGAFSDLKGMGKPIRWDDNPFADPDAEAANILLKNAGFTLPWIAERQEIEAEIESGRRTLLRSWQWSSAGGLPGLAATSDEWQRALVRFREKVAEINKRIHIYNLKVPDEGFQRLPIHMEREIEILTGGDIQGKQPPQL